MTKTKFKKRSSNHALLFIFITVMLDMLALGVMIPVMPKLILNFMNGDSAKSAVMIGLFGTIWAVMQFFFSPILGSLSDRYGRRPVILLSNLGTAVDYVVLAVAPTIGWLFGGRALSGITTSSVSAAFAYIADSTKPEKRAAAFGMIGAAFSVGFVLGPALGGFLGDISLRLPFWISAGLSLLNFLYGLFVLPESLPPSRRVPFQWKKANPVGSLVLLKSHKELLGLAWVYFLNNLAHMVLNTVFVLYAMNRYQWDAKWVGYTLAVVGICTGIVQGGLVRPLVNFFGERNALILGTLFGMIGFAGFGWAPTGLLFWLGIPFMALWGLGSSANQSLMTQHVSHKEQGQLQGANGSIRAIAEMIGPSIFTLTYAYFIAPQSPIALPGAPFFLAGVMMAANGILAWFVTRNGRNR